MKSIFTIINCFFVVLTAYFCVDILYKRVLPQIDGRAVSQDSIKASKTTNTTPKKSQLSLGQNQLISKRNLFKVEVEKQENHPEEPTESEPEKLEPTHLKLVLWGTVTGGDEKFAVIEDKNARQQSLFLVGDTIQGATLKQILRHKVVLSFKGKDQVLEMETENKKTSVSKFAKSFTPSFKPTVMPNLEELPKIANDFMRQIKFRSHYTEGEPDGLMVYGIRPNSVFRKIGLRNGDIVKEVNGTPISSPEDAANLFDEIVTSDQAKLTLLRRGKIQELVYQMDADTNSEDVVLEE